MKISKEVNVQQKDVHYMKIFKEVNAQQEDVHYIKILFMIIEAK